MTPYHLVVRYHNYWKPLDENRGVYNSILTDTKLKMYHIFKDEKAFLDVFPVLVFPGQPLNTRRLGEFFSLIFYKIRNFLIVLLYSEGCEVIKSQRIMNTLY